MLIAGLLASILAAQVVFAQTGVITYESRVNLHRTIPADRQEMKSMMPEYRITKLQLFYNGEESLYKSLIEDEEEQFSSGGGAVRMTMRMPKTEMYTNSSTQAILMVQEFMGKKYLIEDSVKITPWKFGTEVKTILGYACRQATFFNEERKQTIVAWYTDKLRPLLGPEIYTTLPGAVVQVDINDGERVITAIKIEPRTLKKSELKIPSGGTKITEKEFRKMMDEQMQRMGREGGVMIRN